MTQVTLTRRSLVIALLTLALAPAASAQPSVVMIVTDDQRWDTLDVMPTVQAELVGKGVTFTNAFAVNPVCCPSRASILTGTWSHTNGVWDVAGDHGGFQRFDDSSTLATWLDAAGYRSGMLGKYLNGYKGTVYRPPGWDEWFAFTSNPNAYFDFGATDGTSELLFGSDPGEYATDVLAERADAFIRSAGSEPLFLYLAPKAPHIGGPGRPSTPAPRHAGAFAGLDPWQPPNLNEPQAGDKPLHIRSLAPVPLEEIAGLRQTNLESLLAVDEMVARVLAALADTGRLEDTLIVLTSDNGFGWGEHRRAHKIVPYEESIRVPLVVRWDALGAVGTRDAASLNVDLAPTIAAAVGVDAPGAEGRDLLPLLRGEPVRWRKRFLIEAWMRPKWRIPPYCGFRGERWKYVQYETGEEELYDLAQDPYELRSLHRTLLPVAMRHRQLVRQSPCRPPGYTPLPDCTRYGTSGPDVIRGRLRPEWICARGGRDVIRAREGGRDVVRCGRGRDVAYVDRADSVRGCEIVKRSR